jgi:hypothetical protein
MNCTDVEILIADYVDNTLRGEQKTAFEDHLAKCGACAELARDCAGAVAFIGRAANAEPPPELITKLLFEIHSGSSRAVIKPSWARRSFGKFFGRWLAPVFEPRLAMGMAMTVLSFAMLGRLTGIEIRQLRPSDVNPVKIWTAAEDRAQRAWARSVKYYESLKVVYEVETQLKEWTAEETAANEGPEKAPENGADSK